VVGQSDLPAAQQERDQIRRDIESGRDAIDTLSRRLDDAANELNRLRDGLTATAAKIQPIEAELANLGASIVELTNAIAQREADLATRRAAMVNTIAALQRVALRPPATLLISPGDANDIVRTGILLRSAVPLLEQEAADLRADAQALADAKSDLTGRQERLLAAEAELRSEQQTLAGLSREKAALFADLGNTRDAAAEQLDQRLTRADDLDDLIGELQRRAAARRSADPGDDPAVIDMYRLLRPVIGAEGQMSSPAQGRLLNRFGDPSPFGGTHKGVSFAIAPGAQIFAPWDGRVVFAGPFRDFGLILIIDHGQEYHSLIAGFAEMTAAPEQWVLAGEPLGSAPLEIGAQPEQNDGSAAPMRGNDDSPVLYVELRQDGSPVNPLPWLAARNDRVDR